MKKVLIFYASYGGGHLSAAKSIQKYITENYEDVEEYDNVFLDNTVIRSDDMFDSEEFWTENGGIIKAIKYIKLNYA